MRRAGGVGEEDLPYLYAHCESPIQPSPIQSCLSSPAYTHIVKVLSPVASPAPIRTL